MKRLAVLFALVLALLLAVPVCAEEEPLILQRPDDALEALAWAKEQEWEKTYTIGFGNISENSGNCHRRCLWVYKFLLHHESQTAALYRHDGNDAGAARLCISHDERPIHHVDESGIRRVGPW